MRSTGASRPQNFCVRADIFLAPSPLKCLALSPLGERVACAGAFFSRRGTGEGVESRVPARFRITNGYLRAEGRV
jgi:hypothetical protein